MIRVDFGDGNDDLGPIFAATEPENRHHTAKPIVDPVFKGDGLAGFVPFFLAVAVKIASKLRNECNQDRREVHSKCWDLAPSQPGSPDPSGDDDRPSARSARTKSRRSDFPWGRIHLAEPEQAMQPLREAPRLQALPMASRRGLPKSVPSE